MSVVHHDTSQQKPGWRFFPSGSAYPTPKSTIHSPPLLIHHQRRYVSLKAPYTPHGNIPPPTDRTKPFGHQVHIHPADRVQPEQQHQQRQYMSPRSFEIISPSGRKQMMVLVERVSHITAQVEYGLVPADPNFRRYDEKGLLIGNQRMELLSPKVAEDTVRGTFFFAEKRPVAPVTASSPERAKVSREEHESKKKDAGDQTPKRSGSKRREKEKDATSDKDEKKDKSLQPTILTLLEQLVSLRVLRIIPSVRCKSIEHKGACLVRILLTDTEIAHACSSPRHSYFLYEAPMYARFKVCTSCRAVPFRRGVYYCSEACLAADWPQHRIECGKTREQLQHIISMLPTILHPRPPAPAHLRVQTHRPLWYRAWLWMGYAAETNKENVIDLKEWKVNVKSRTSAGCRDLLPGF